MSSPGSRFVAGRTTLRWRDESVTVPETKVSNIIAGAAAAAEWLAGDAKLLVQMGKFFEKLS
jgi:hypothetical protein